MENENNVDTIIDDLKEETGIGKRDRGWRSAAVTTRALLTLNSEGQTVRTGEPENGRTGERENGNWGRVGGVHDEDTVDGADTGDVLDGKEQSENP
jgi:hypothetical protein